MNSLYCKISAHTAVYTHLRVCDLLNRVTYHTTRFMIGHITGYVFQTIDSTVNGKATRYRSGSQNEREQIA